MIRRRRVIIDHVYLSRTIDDSGGPRHLAEKRRAKLEAEWLVEDACNAADVDPEAWLRLLERRGGFRSRFRAGTTIEEQTQQITDAIAAGLEPADVRAR
jgi:hypothetical protein